MIPAFGPFIERLREHAARRADAVALVSEHAHVSYRDLDREVRTLAAQLHARGLAKGAIAGLTVRGELDHLVATLALFELGVAQVSLASRDPPSARSHLARRIGVTHVIVDRHEDAVPGVAVVELAAARSSAVPPDLAARAMPLDPKAPALYLTGSGTTGELKIVCYSQRDLARQAVRSYGDLGRQRVLRLASVEYNNSKRLRLYTLYLGGTCVLRDGSTETVHRVCARFGVTLLELATLHAEDLLRTSRSEGPLPAGTAVRIGGSRVPAALRRALIAEVTPDLHVSYGATEVAFVAVAGPALHGASEPVGAPCPGVSVEVLREDGSRAAPDEIGEIRIRAEGMARAYVGDPVASGRHFRDGWFVPGDLASLDADGVLHIHGRKDDMMIMNGINIFPAEIERVLESHPAVGAAAALPLASDVHGQIPVAAVELRTGRDCTVAELIGYARGELGVRAPRRIEIFAALPRNAQGKVVKRELAGRFGAQRS